jgi:hypothetical protein
MYATEFQTVINDPYIKIPEYESFKGHEVRVILLDIQGELYKKESNDEVDFIDYLIENPIEISKGTKFLSREEANAR